MVSSMADKFQDLSKGYKKTEIGVIPDDWEIKSVGELCTLKSGLSITSKSIDSNGKYRCFGGNGLRGYTTNFTHNGEYALIGRQGALCGNVQHVSGKFFASEHALVASSVKNVNTRWLAIYFGNMNLNQYSESSAQPGLSAEKLRILKIVTPKLKEQIAIADALSDVDELINSLEKLIAKKQAIKTGAMQLMLTGKKRLPPFDQNHTGYKQTELGEIPEDWEVAKLGDMGFDISDGNYSSKYPRADEFKQTGVPFIRANNIKNLTVIDHDMRFISKEKHSEITKGHLKKGDVLITNRGEIGNLAIVPDTHEGSNINAQIVRINTGGSLVENLYFAYFLQKKEVQQRFQDLQTGSALKQLPVNRLLTLTVFFPSKEEQLEISKFMSDIDLEIFTLKNQLTKTKQFKQGMMQELLTGRTRLI